MLDRIFSIDTLWILLLILYIPACIGLIIIVLLQKGKGTGFGGAFGVGGGGEAVFGPRASRSVPVRLTYIAATLFMTIALIMSLISHRVGKGQAPEMVGVATEDGGEEVTGSRFSDLGIGTGRVDEDRVDASALTAPLTTDEDADARPEGRPGQVWSEEHGHWHDAPEGTTPLTSQGQDADARPEGRPGQVWSEEHGHWHDAPAVDGAVPEAEPEATEAPTEAPQAAEEAAADTVEAPTIDGNVAPPEAASEASAAEEATPDETTAEDSTPEPEGTN